MRCFRRNWRISGNSAGPPPPGYVRRSEARNAGTATADASFETLLWAVEHRDTNALFSVTDGPWRDSIVRQLAGSTVEELFKSMPLPGRSDSGPEGAVTRHRNFPSSWRRARSCP